MHIEIKKHKEDDVILFIFLLLVLFFTRFYALFNVGALFYQFEGLYRGWLAKEFLDGAGWRHIFNHPFFSAEGGSVTVSYIVSLFFLLLGDNFLALTLVSILFSALILTVFYLLLKRHFSLYTAIVFSFLFIFSHLVFFQYSLYTIGFHFESIFFSILGLFCFFEIFFNENHYRVYIEKTPNKKLNLLFITLGMVSGFGVYFFYDYLIMLCTITLFWLFIDKRFFLKKRFHIFLVGFIIGFLPWLIYNTTHNFNGLSINDYSLSKVMFSKSLPQMFQTFAYIVTDKLLRELGIKLYLTIVFSFGLIVLLNLKSFKYLFSVKPQYLHKIKELIFIGYVLAFIFTWSIAYLPISEENVPSWMSGLWGRLMHLYPFLFVLVALCFNRLLAFKKDKAYFLKIAVSLIFSIWILGIGYLNYSNLLSHCGNKIPSSSLIKINPFKIKGYSVRLVLKDKMPVNGFLGQDMYKVGMATNCDGMLWQELFIFDEGRDSLYTYNDELLQKMMNNIHLDEGKKPYYYLLLGLNTGDLMEGYDILNLNKLTIQKVPIQYRHYVYEGVAVSLMNRRRNEIMKNIDFIDKVPMEYRHYFLLELGRVAGSYPDDRIREEKLQYSIKRFPGAYESYIRRGLIEGLANKDLLKHQQGYNIQENDLSYIYRAISRHLFGNFPSESDAFDMLKNFKIDKNNERYYYWGIIEAYFKDNSVYQEDVVKTKIDAIIKANWTNKDTLYEGLGLSLGHLTFGHIKTFTGPLESSLDANQLSRFYYGYSISLKERYGLDSDMMKKLVDDNVTEGYKEMCYRVILNKIVNGSQLF